MRTRLVASCLVGAVVLLGACGSPETTTDGSPGSGGSDPNVGSDAPIVHTPAPPGDVDPGGGRAQRVRPRPGMADVRAVGWDKARQTSSGRSLRVTYWSGVEPCNVLDHVDVAYSPKAITITLFEGHDPEEADVACIEIALQKVVKVALEEPVDGRKLVDGAR